jgi:hypothetical protein
LNRDILKALGARKLTAADIARKIGYPRTTIQFRLKGLLRERLISKSAYVGRKIFYSVNAKAVNEARGSRLIQIFTGTNIIHGYSDFVDAPKNSIIYSIQGAIAVKRILKALPTDFIKEAHRKFKRRGVILKGFANKKSLSMFSEIDTEMVKSHSGRSVGVKLIEGGIFEGPCELLCSMSSLLISDLEKRRAILLKDKDVVGLMFEILSLLYSSSEHIRVFSLNEYLNKIQQS